MASGQLFPGVMDRDWTTAWKSHNLAHEAPQREPGAGGEVGADEGGNRSHCLLSHHIAAQKAKEVKNSVFKIALPGH